MEDNIIINGIDASLKHFIKLNFYFNFPNDILEDENAYVTLTNEKNEESFTIFVKDAEYTENIGYKFSIPIAPKYIMDPILIKVFDGNNNNLTFMDKNNNIFSNGLLYSLEKYFIWAEKYETEERKQFYNVVKNFCYAAQLYFDYNTDYNKFNNIINVVNPETLNEYIATKEGIVPTGITVQGITAVLTEGIEFRLYIKFKNNYAPLNFTFKIDNNITQSKQSDIGYYLSLDSLAGYDQSNISHVYSISSATRTYTITASPLTFYRSYMISNNIKQKALGETAYLYYLAASNAQED